METILQPAKMGKCKAVLGKTRLLHVRRKARNLASTREAARAPDSGIQRNQGLAVGKVAVSINVGIKERFSTPILRPHFDRH